MAPPEESTHHLLTSSQLSVSRSLSSGSSLISTNKSPLVGSSADPEKASAAGILDRSRVTNRVRHGGTALDTPPLVVSAVIPRIARPSAYGPSLSPLPSPLRPHCLAKDRLRLWKPSPDVCSRHSSAQEDDVGRVFEVMSNAWADSTRETYSAGILVYHVYCDVKGLPENVRAPTTQSTITSFITSLTGSYSGSTIHNYIHGIRAWHVLHGLEWKINPLEMDAVLKGAIYHWVHRGTRSAHESQ